MKNKSNKIAKLLFKAGNLKEEAFSAQKAGKSKKYKKNISSAEKYCRQALKLSRGDISNGTNDGCNDLINSIYGLTSILCRTDRCEEAEPLLAEARELSGFKDSMYVIAINSYYGCILCDRGDYDAAAEIFSSVLSDAEKNQYAAFVDIYALCGAYGNTGCALTFAEKGYPRELFFEPLKRMMEIKEKGFEIDNNLLKKAAYFDAYFNIHLMCFVPPTKSNSEYTVNAVKQCLEFCEASGELDFYNPAAKRLLAFAVAMDGRYRDCAEICDNILETCSKYSGDMGKSPYGSIQDIAADANLLLGIMHYRAENFEPAVQYLEASIAALEADAHGRPLKDVGYREIEMITIAMTSAEKASFAYKYIGLALNFMDEEKNLPKCIEYLKKSADTITSISDYPYFYLEAAANYEVMSKLCEQAGDMAGASEFSEISKKHGYFALSNIKKYTEDKEHYDQHLKMAEAHGRLALRHGMFERYGDYLRYQIMLHEEPYVVDGGMELAQLYYYYGELFRCLGKLEPACDCYDNACGNAFDSNGNMREEESAGTIAQDSMISKADCLAKLGNIAEANKTFALFVELDKMASNGTLSADELTRIARLSIAINLNHATCAQYSHTAAEECVKNDDDSMRAAKLFNQEGLCWYNASPETDAQFYGESNDSEPMEVRYSRINAEFSIKELEAFQSSYREILKCDGQLPGVLDLMPSLLSNIAECYARREEYELALKYYQNSADAFEKLFVSQMFSAIDDEAKNSYLFQYGLCFKSKAEIYEKIDDSQSSVKEFTKAIEVFEKIDSDSARYELSFCLNARGCMNYRLENYQGEVDDVTRAISIRYGEKDSEISIAIMLKNRSDAYQALGNYKAMKSDLTNSIDMLDKSDAPKEALNPIYGENWYYLGVCHEEMKKAGNAADAYHKAEKYLSAVQSPSDDQMNVNMRALCHFRRANCLSRRDEEEYYGALSEYGSALELLEELPSSAENNERLMAVLASRGSLYEAFREIDLAKADYNRVEQLKKDLPQSISDSE